MSSSLKDLKIFVVEDNPHMRRLLCELLAFLDVSEIRECCDGEEALETLETFTPDLCILDLFMQPMDGMTFLRHLRNRPGNPNRDLPVIMMTGYADRSVVEEARDHGATEFMVKPITVTALYSRIRDVLQNPREFIDSSDYVGPDRRRRHKPFESNRRWDDLSDDKESTDPHEADKGDGPSKFYLVDGWKDTLKRQP